MKHNLTVKQSLGNRKVLLHVQLTPENEKEATSLKNVELVKASDEEREFIDNWLLYTIGSVYSPITTESKGNGMFIVKACQN